MVEKKQSLLESEEIGKLVTEHAESQGVERFDYKSPTQQSKLQYALQYRIFNIAGRFKNAVEFELETGLGFNLVPVFLALGIIIYFAAPVEPLAITVLLPVVLLIAVSKMAAKGRSSLVLLALTIVLSGASLAKLNVSWTQNHQIPRQITAEVQAVVIEVEQNRRGLPRYVLRPLQIDEMKSEELPERIRLSSPSKKKTFIPGDVVKGLARLQPVSGPVYPGGYDFSFFARFEKLGGSGFFMGAPKKVEANHSIQLTDRILAKINLMRFAIANRIKQVLPGSAGQIATALVIGDKTGIPEDIQNSLRATGLAHVLAISGLHMALVALTVIWLFRLALMSNPQTVQRYPAKKWAAALGFLFATIYLGISGWGIATQRAWIMISVMLCSVLLDRRAITIRSVAISAFLILLVQPSSLFNPGFQMSFAAVAALVATYEAINKRRQLRAENTNIATSRAFGSAAKIRRFLLVYVGGLALTSLVAGTATGFIAAWHFHQVPKLGLIANILAMPFVTLLVMPGVLFSIVLMPFGYEHLALYPVAWGIENIVDISKWVEVQNPVLKTGVLSDKSLGFFTAGLLVLTLLRTRLRLIGVLLFLPIFMMPHKREVPDILIAENGRAVAVTDIKGELSLLFPERENFVTRIWAKSQRVERLERIQKQADECTKDRCIHILQSSLTLHVVYDPDLLSSSCKRADILIAPRLRWVNCYTRQPQLILKRGDFETHGSHSVFVKRLKPGEHEINLTKALPTPIRPWHRQANTLYDP